MTHSSELLSTYSVPLIILSFVIAACASFCALELVAHVANANAFTRRLWLFAGAATFGLGTWAMHFIGMLAFDLNMPIGYHLPTVLFSIFPVMAATAFALSLAARENVTKPQLFGGAVLLGVGIGGMHYSGMLSMRMDAITYYDPKFLLISVLFAVGASLFALYSTIETRSEMSHGGERFISAGIMGGAITGLHFTAMMNASHFTANSSSIPVGMIPSPLTNAAPTGDFVFQVPALAAVLIAIAILGVVAVVLQQARRAEINRHVASRELQSIVTGTAGD